MPSCGTRLTDHGDVGVVQTVCRTDRELDLVHAHVQELLQPSVFLVHSYREKYHQLADYVPEGAVERGIHIRENATDESEGLHKFHIRIRGESRGMKLLG